MRLLAFQSGKAMLRPTSRMAKIVIVFATAHKHPASTPQTTRWGAFLTSVRICCVPRSNAGTLQRARNTPITINNETITGEIPIFTSLVGASAAPSHAPALKPERIPISCSARNREAWAAGSTPTCLLEVS